jgi:hypothetical protein
MILANCYLKGVPGFPARIPSTDSQHWCQLSGPFNASMVNTVSILQIHLANIYFVQKIMSPTKIDH